MGPDGEPLPPDLQREVDEKLKSDPLPAAAKRSRPIANKNAAAGGESGDILVTGQRPRGSVVGDIPAEQTFNPLDIRAYGAGDIGELLQTLAPQVRSSRGRDDRGPLVLLNGRRVSSSAEIANIPTEAIERMEIFPEELALKYGYRADQKVINVVTFEKFSSQIGQISYARPTEGGRDTIGKKGNYLRIRGDTRVNLNGNYSRSSYLLESDRGVLQTAGSLDQWRYRTLLPKTEGLTFNGTISGTISSGVSSALNGRFEASRSKSLFGLGSHGPLARDTDTEVAHLGTTHGGMLGKWLWSFTSNYDRVSTHLLTDTDSSLAAQDEARSVDSIVGADIVLSGALLKLPTGPISMSFRGGVDARDFDSRSRRGAIVQEAERSRERVAMRANLDIPIAGRRLAGRTWLGDLSANANLAVEGLSDVGTLWTIGYGFNWSPIATINIIASVTNEGGAPTVEQLGAPLVVTPNLRTYDLTRREIVDVTRVFGGNPGLRPDDRRAFKFGVNVRPFPKSDLILSFDYNKSRTENPIVIFPIATPEIETAFPDRFTRDANGTLLRIDNRPLNYNRADQDQLRWGVDFTRPLGLLPPGMQNANVRFAGSEADLQRTLPAGSKIIKVEQGSPAAKRVENMSSRLILSVYYTLRLTDAVILRDDSPALDLLNGSAIDSRGGRPRHEVEFQAGAFKSGLGARATARWQSGTTVTDFSTSLANSGGDLAFPDYAVVSINLFANVADRLGGAKAPGWVKGMRISVGVANLFNTRPEPRGKGGGTPLSYQAAYLDPLGRLASLSVRKMF